MTNEHFLVAAGALFGLYIGYHVVDVLILLWRDRKEHRELCRVIRESEVRRRRWL